MILLSSSFSILFIGFFLIFGMKKISYTLIGIFALLAHSAYDAQAQPVITNASFPVAGDVWQISTTTDPNMTVTPSQPLAQTWDFRHLVTDSYREETIEDAANGLNILSFPSADVIQPLISGLGGTAYVDVSNTAVTRIGAGLELFGFSFVGTYTDPHILQTAPLNIAGNRLDNFDIRFGENIDSVPFLRQLIDQATATTPIPGGVSPDSIRIKISGSRRMYNEAHGTCMIYDGNYNVLRQKVTEYTNTFVEVRVASPFNPASGFWFDVTDILLGALPLPVAIPTNDTTIYYDYLAEGYKQPIVRQNMSNDGNTVESIEFKGQYTVGTTLLVDNTFLDFSIRPNPAQSEFVQLIIGDEQQAEDYSLIIVDLQGKELIRKIGLSGRTQTISIDHITTSGIYPCHFYDKKGRLIRTQLLQIIR
jgi:hypothetical protein